MIQQDSAGTNTEGYNYWYGTQSHVSYQGYTSLLFKEHPMKAARICVNYTKYQINEILSQYNSGIFGMSQASHTDTSSDDCFCYNNITMEDEIQLEEGKVSPSLMSVSNTEGDNYRYGTQSHVSYKGYPSLLFK